jgi:hypothetical protein
MKPLTAALALSLAACGGAADDEHGHTHGPGEADHEHPPADAAAESEQGHEHAEDPLDPITIGDLTVELAQGHGPVAAGREGHLVVKLPYSDGGATIVRAWIGTEDRLASYVGKGEYAPDHDDYDVHATAPDPLPADAMWWVELEQPDGTKRVGSAPPILE